MLIANGRDHIAAHRAVGVMGENPVDQKDTDTDDLPVHMIAIRAAGRAKRAALHLGAKDFVLRENLTLRGKQWVSQAKG